MLKETVLSLITALGPGDAECLALNAYFEARNQSESGMIAVSHVVLNRVQSDRYPDTVCGVVKQARYSKWWQETHGKDVPIRHQCQFSWYCDGLSDYPKEKAAWKTAQRVAMEAYALHNVGFDITDGSLWYHAKNVNPYWADAFDYVMHVDDHLFYRPKS